MMKAERTQQEYYTRTAHLYDDMHVHIDDEHYVALQYVSGLISQLGIASVLDVGCGTGRGIKYLLERNPEVRVHGIDPVKALLQQASGRNLIPANFMSLASGEALPFADQSFDASCELGVLHHVREPNRVVQEMMCVSKKAIFLSDENRFAHGKMFSRWAKLALCNLGIFRGAYFIKTLGKGHRWTEGDGLAYSYSVFDSFKMLSDWGDRVILIPTDNVKPQSRFHPLLTSFHVLLCAIRQQGPE